MQKRVFFFMGGVHPGNMTGGVLVSGAPGGGLRVELTGDATFREADPNDESKSIGGSDAPPAVSRDESDGDPLAREYQSDAALRKAAADAGIANRIGVVTDAANMRGRQLWPEYGSGKGSGITYVRTPTGTLRRVDGSESVFDMLGTGTVSGDGSGTALPMASGGTLRTAQESPQGAQSIGTVLPTPDTPTTRPGAFSRAGRAATAAQGGQAGQDQAKADAGE